MNCPHCNHNDSQVIDSRPRDLGKTICRRRKCKSCGQRWTTFEQIGERTPVRPEVEMLFRQLRQKLVDVEVLIRKYENSREIGAG